MIDDIPLPLLIVLGVVALIAGLAIIGVILGLVIKLLIWGAVIGGVVVLGYLALKALGVLE